MAKKRGHSFKLFLLALIATTFGGCAIELGVRLVPGALDFDEKIYEKLCAYARGENPTAYEGRADTVYRLKAQPGVNSLGFADRVGFRCGTCYEYPVFNLETGRALRLTERPLVVMDNTLLEARYMEMDRETAFEHVGKLADHCRSFDGDFVLLWHNSSLAATWQKDLYERVLDRVTG